MKITREYLKNILKEGLGQIREASFLADDESENTTKAPDLNREYRKAMLSAIQFKIEKRTAELEKAIEEEHELQRLRGEKSEEYSQAQKNFKGKDKKTNFPTSKEGVRIQGEIDEIDRKLEIVKANKVSAAEKKRFHENVMQNYNFLSEAAAYYVKIKTQLDASIIARDVEKNNIAEQRAKLKQLKAQGVDTSKDTTDKNVREIFDDIIEARDLFKIKDEEIQYLSREIAVPQVQFKKYYNAFNANRRHYVDENGQPVMSPDEIDEPSSEPEQTISNVPDAPESTTPADTTPEAPVEPETSEPETQEEPTPEPTAVPEEDREVVRLTSDASELQRFANAIAKLGDKDEKDIPKERAEQLRQIEKAIAQKLQKLMLRDREKVNKKKGSLLKKIVDALPQEYKSLEDSVALQMFEPSGENTLTLSPEVAELFKFEDDDGNPIKFQINSEDIIEAPEELEKIEDAVKDVAEKPEQLGIPFEADSEKEEEEVVNFEDEIRKKNIIIDRLKKNIGIAKDNIKNGRNVESNERKLKTILEPELEKIIKEKENLQAQKATKDASEEELIDTVAKPETQTEPEVQADTVPEPPQETPPIPSAEETPEEETGLSVGGWSDAKRAVRTKIKKAKPTLEQILDSLGSVEAFTEFWNIKDGADVKLKQARDLFDSKYIEEQLGIILGMPDDQKVQAAENLVATTMGYYEFLKSMGEKNPEFVLPQTFEFPNTVPESPEQFEREFVQPLMPTTKPQTNKEGLKEEQYIQIADANIAKSETLSSNELAQQRDMKVFIGWYIMSKQSGLLQEQDEREQILSKYTGVTKFFDTTKGDGPKYVDETIKKSVKKKLVKNTNDFKVVMDAIQELIDNGSIEIPDSIPFEMGDSEVEKDTKMIAQQAIEDAPEVDPQQDKDLSPLEQEEMDVAWKETLDIFFGKNPSKSSFMRRLLLKDQASMLYGMIDTLEKIISGGRKTSQGEEVASISDEKPEESSETVDLEEQIINEIFGMFSDKKEEQQIQISNKTTKFIRQDLEAMVDLLRSLKIDISNYKEYATRTSVDPRFDGSTLKRAMDIKLEAVQEAIAHLVKNVNIEIEQQANKSEVEFDKTFSGSEDEIQNEVFDVFSSNLVMEQESDRKLKIKQVREVYGEMRRMYLKGLMVSLENNDSENSKRGASQIKEYVMSQKQFLSYFPTNIITSSGRVMTLGDAYESMKEIIGKFVEAIRDMVTITKTQKVSSGSLYQAMGELISISEKIEELFKVPSQIDKKILKALKKQETSNDDNQSVTDEEKLTATPFIDEEGDLEQTTSDEEIKPLLQKLADFIKKEGLLSESLGRLIKDIDIKDKKKFGRKVGKIFTKEEFEKINSYFENEQNRKSFISEYFKSEDSLKDSSELDADDSSDRKTDIPADEEVNPEEEYYNEIYDTLFTSLHNIVEKHFQDKSFEEKLFAFKTARAFTKIFLEFKADENPSLAEFINDLRKDRSEMNESEEERDIVHEFFSLENGLYNEIMSTSIYAKFKSYAPDSTHEKTLKQMRDLSGDGIPKGAYDFLTDEKNKEFYNLLVKYTSMFYKELKKHLRNTTKESIEKTLKPIIEKMLKEHYNY